MNKKVALFTIAMVLLLGVTMGVTFALMTAQTKTLTNTFVAGGFGKLELLEHKLVDANSDGSADVGANGLPILDNASAAVAAADSNVNTYTMFPGAVLPKDPHVTFTFDSTAVKDAYLFITIGDEGENWVCNNNKVTNSDLSFTVNNSWKKLDNEENVYYMKISDDVTADDTYIIDENQVEVSVDADSTSLTALNNTKLTFKAYAIQNAGEKDVATLWEDVSTAAANA